MLWKSLAIAAIAAAPGLAAAQEPALAFPGDGDAGRTEYMVACAVCHGESAKGDGPIAGLLNIDTPDLTTLAAAHDGVFPYQTTLETIDGRNEVRAHGSAMPVWGTRYFVTAATADGYDPVQADLMAKGRILALAEYLRSIQE